MCGIVGFTHFSGCPQESLQILHAMCMMQSHRGPDGSGTFQDQRVSLGHSRLAIIDLKTGDQPLGNEDKTVQTVFNGEIYNFRELRKELIKEGHIFTTESDTEVLVHGYESWGEGIISRLNGMFALAIYDSRNTKLLLARDRLGQKPLHYAWSGESLVFASEIKSLLVHPSFSNSRELNFSSLLQYLALEYVPTPQCMIKGFRKLRPGHFLVVKPGTSKEMPYWNLEKAVAKVETPTDFQEAADIFWNYFKNAVKRRLVSDVPLGVFLSGGIDSLAVALAARQAAHGELRTFSIGFNDKGFDETPHALAAAKAVGTSHASEQLSLEAMYQTLPKVLDGLDEPIADSSIIPTYLLCNYTRSHVTVSLSGDGGDELLAGYPTFKAHRLAVQLGQPLGRILRLFAPMINRCIPVSHASLSWDFKLKWFLRGLGLPAGERLLTWLGAFSGEERHSLFSSALWEELRDQEDPRKSLAGTANDFKSLGQLSKLYLRTYLENDILVKIDRASMLNSLEVRSPFLDHELVAFLVALPDYFKLHPKLGSKALLKHALLDHVPLSLIKRSKQGFGVPISAWLQGPLNNWVNELLDPQRLQNEGLFNAPAVMKLLHEHRSKRRDNRKFLWPLIMFQAWRERYLDIPLQCKVNL